MERLSYPFDKGKIPLNGIYILFEKGEIAHSVDRIVQVGSHIGDDNLLARLKEHFMKENKDRSVFRKNIGRAILYKNNDSFLPRWELDLTSKEMRNKYLPIINVEKQKETEGDVTKHIHDNITFVVFRIDDKNARLALESKIISTVSLCECKQTDTWLGNYSSKEKIRKSGLWLEKELQKTPLNDEDVQYLEKVINQG
jgi:hypothetical protein